MFLYSIGKANEKQIEPVGDTWEVLEDFSSVSKAFTSWFMRSGLVQNGSVL